MFKAQFLIENENTKHGLLRSCPCKKKFDKKCILLSPLLFKLTVHIILKSRLVSHLQEVK